MEHFPVTVLPGGRITIPAKIRKHLNLQPGDTLIWSSRDGAIHFRKVEPGDAETPGKGEMGQSDPFPATGEHPQE